MESINLFLRRCKSPGLFLDEVELVSLDGSTVIGAFSDEVYSVRGQDQVTAAGVPTANRAGTVNVDLRRNTDLSGAAITLGRLAGGQQPVPTTQALNRLILNSRWKMEMFFPVTRSVAEPVLSPWWW